LKAHSSAGLKAAVKLNFWANIFTMATSVPLSFSPTFLGLKKGPS
jgi:hypothetical protein